MVVDIVMPKLGESIMEATILKWLKNPGDKVEQEEILLEIATDKVDSEVPSTVSGIVASVLYKVNDVVPVGKPIAIIQTDAASASKQSVPSAPKSEPFTQPEKRAEVVSGAPTTPVSSEGRFYSPLVMNIARSEGISMSELESLPGSIRL